MRKFWGILFVIVSLIASSRIATADLYIANDGNGTIGDYTNSGAVINPNFITGLSGPGEIAVSASNLYVVSPGGTIAEYSLSGNLIDPNFISGLSNPAGLVLSNGDLYVTTGPNYPTIGGSVDEYDATTGLPVNTPLISNLATPLSVAIAGSDIYVAQYGNGLAGTGTIVKYSTSGAPEGTPLVTGLMDPGGMAISGSDLFVINEGADGNNHNGTIGEYDTTTGNTVNASFLTGLNSPAGIAVFNGDIYVSDLDDGTIGEYNLSGNSVNPSFVTGLNAPENFIFTPLPSTSWVLAAAGMVIAVGRLRTSIKAKRTSRVMAG